MSKVQATEDCSASEGLLTMSPSFVKDRMNRAEQPHNNSVLATSLYICKAIIGAGMLSLPVALDAAGWYLGIIMLVVFACLSQMTCHYLAVVINNFREFTIPRNPFMKFRDEHLYVEVDQHEISNYENGPSEVQNAEIGRYNGASSSQSAGDVKDNVSLHDSIDTAEAVEDQHEREKWQVDPKNLSEILLPRNFTWLLDLVIFLQTLKKNNSDLLVNVENC